MTTFRIVPDKEGQAAHMRELLSESHYYQSIWQRKQQKQPCFVDIVTDEIHQAETAARLIAETICDARKFGISHYFTCQYLKQFKVLLDGLEGAGANYKLIVGTHKENFELLKEELGYFQTE